MRIIDLSQEIFSGMPVFDGLPEVSITTHATHEQWLGLTDATTATPAVNLLVMSEHTGTHVDSISHMGREFAGQTIEKMPLSQFYTEGIALDFSHKKMMEAITAEEIRHACHSAQLDIRRGDTVLFYTDHYRRYFGTEHWPFGPGLTAEATEWLGNQGVAGFGVETMAPGIRKVSNRDVHRICGEMGFTHYENLINLHELIGLGRFQFIALPLKIRGGTGSPVRAVAVV